MPGWLIALLVVVIGVVLVVAVLAVLAVHGMRRYVAAAKTVEATNTINEIARDAETKYASDKVLCKSASKPVPPTIPPGKKYVSSPGDWTADPADAGFTCLGFSLSMPQYYQYDYQAPSRSEFKAIARGDLDYDGKTSEYSLGGKVVAGAVVLDPAPHVKPE